MKILATTDFSPASVDGVLYATQLAMTFQAELLLLHTVSVTTAGHAQAALREQKLTDSVAQEADAEMESLFTHVKSIAGENFPAEKRIIISSDLADTINELARNESVHLVVMGTTGASGLKAALLGSNASHVINASELPVITVPRKYAFNDIRLIAYASDLSFIDDELSVIAPFATAFNASLLLLHVNVSGAEKDFGTASLIAESAKRHGNVRIVVRETDAENVPAGLDKLISEQAPDLLVLFRREHGFFDKLFGRSVTVKMSYHASVPLLTIHKTLSISKLNS